MTETPVPDRAASLWASLMLPPWYVNAMHLDEYAPEQIAEILRCLDGLYGRISDPFLRPLMTTYQWRTPDGKDHLAALEFCIPANERPC